MASLEFVWWWAFLLLPLPLIINRLLPPVKTAVPVQLPFLPSSKGQAAPKQTLLRALAVVVWIFLLTALARPVWYGEPVTHQPEHRDLMLVVDLSGSMAQEDMRQGDQFIDRLTAVKNVLTDFINKRTGDRMGLVVFADHAYLQTPLTLDRQTVSQQLNQTVLGLIGSSTAIGDGIAVATKTFIDSDAPQRVMILLSDGSNTAGVLDPMEAAEIAKQYGTTIYTVGVGAGEMVVKEFFMTRKVDTARDLDEESLKSIAQLTGGQYFRSRDTQDLASIYDTINELEPVSEAVQTWRPQTEWFGLPLSISLLLCCVVIVLRRGFV
ncbi:vWA domain-containing protein [Vibrio genomosp. F10]|uniref:IMP dehydrogenase n=3 Tax=Vibrio genomosp. F10 TaxID=723171 RepID=A0A1B9R329_9VIBR|nr:VWA domain-containing protein [Vibrio genomosp. F10]OCH78693.1 IMP dehydrogenase [Vibrio genomosp. F10]OEE37449.1 IMP dehydrogenase [Vibrio genomosp. F10 str. ZF-129]OEF07476.1 IMP dehydrogenase [Vibrio genomosp. F10 str. 9ZB36]